MVSFQIEFPAIILRPRLYLLEQDKVPKTKEMCQNLVLIYSLANFAQSQMDVSLQILILFCSFSF